MQIENIQQALEARSYAPGSNVIDLSSYPEKHREAVQAVADLFIIHEAYNDGEVADYSDYDQEKYLIWWDLEVTKRNPSGFRFFGSLFGLTDTYTVGGPRLCLLKKEDIEHAGKHHIELYRKVNTILKELKK